MNSMEDTMLMSYALMLEKIDITWILCLKFILNHKTISFKDLVGSGKKEINFSEVKLIKLTGICCRRC